MDGCALCANVANGPERGWLFEGGSWAVAGAPIEPSHVAGNVFVQTRRDVTALDASDAEWAELGPLLQRVVQAVQEAASTERVYFYAWGERTPHFHVLVSPRDSVVPAEHRGPNYLLNISRYHDPARFEPVETKLRELLASAPRGSVSA